MCALGSFLDAIAHGGHWLIRMEDLDPPREMPGAAERILHSLHAHGLRSHFPVVWQSKRHDLYQQALQQLRARDQVYRCSCTREQVRKAGGHTRDNCIGASGPYALRFACAGTREGFADIWQGTQQQAIDEDPILKRKDGLYAYQLAVVVDDIAQGINHVVRGADLLDCTGIQQSLFRALGAEPPHFGHLPLVMNDAGQKLSKQNHAAPLDDSKASLNLIQALGFLGLRPPHELAANTPAHILAWASAHWQRKAVDRHNRLLD